MTELFSQPDMAGLSEEERSQVLLVIKKAKVVSSSGCLTGSWSVWFVI